MQQKTEDKNLKNNCRRWVVEDRRWKTVVEEKTDAVEIYVEGWSRGEIRLNIQKSRVKSMQSNQINYNNERNK
jgi:hypothetical protein